MSQVKHDEPHSARLTDPSYAIDELCRAEHISRSMLYKLWEQGKGPRFFYIGNSRRISHEARIEWRQRLEAEAEKAGDAR
jgi:hypothetical protein